MVSTWVGRKAVDLDQLEDGKGAISDTVSLVVLGASSPHVEYRRNRRIPQ